MMNSRPPQIPNVLSSPSLNRGVGFTREQRRELGLTGRLPSGVLTLEQQAERVWRQLQGMPTNLARNLLLGETLDAALAAQKVNVGAVSPARCQLATQN